MVMIDPSPSRCVGEAVLDDDTVAVDHAPPCRRVIVLFCFADQQAIEGGALTHRLDLLCGLRICILASLNAALRAMRLGQVVQICHTRWECAVVRPVFARDHD
jgi:hypothetical protein